MPKYRTYKKLSKALLINMADSLDPTAERQAFMCHEVARRTSPYQGLYSAIAGEFAALLAAYGVPHDRRGDGTVYVRSSAFNAGVQPDIPASPAFRFDFINLLIESL